MQPDDSGISGETGGSHAGLRRREALKALATLAGAPLAAQAQNAAEPAAVRAGSVAANQRNQPFDDHWRFLRGDAAGAERPEFDDSSWRVLDLPHDFSVEDLPPRSRRRNRVGIRMGHGPASGPHRPLDTELSAGGRDTGWFVGGTGWYRKRFSAAATGGRRGGDRLRRRLHEQRCLAQRPSAGQPSLRLHRVAYDLTPYLNPPEENVLAVRVRNEGQNSRWYSGSGIYRHVWLTRHRPVHVPLWGVFVTTPEVCRRTRPSSR